MTSMSPSAAEVRQRHVHRPTLHLSPARRKGRATVNTRVPAWRPIVSQRRDWLAPRAPGARRRWNDSTRNLSCSRSLCRRCLPRLLNWSRAPLSITRTYPGARPSQLLAAPRRAAAAKLHHPVRRPDTTTAAAGASRNGGSRKSSQAGSPDPTVASACRRFATRPSWRCRSPTFPQARPTSSAFSSRPTRLPPQSDLCAMSGGARRPYPARPSLRWRCSP